MWQSKEFAPGYSKNTQGWFQFPRDIGWRKSLYPPAVFDHPAKANLHLQKVLIEYLTEPGDTFMDPFGGTGTAMIGMLMGRNVVLCELEPIFQEMIGDTLRKWIEEEPEGWTGKQSLRLLKGDCRLVLPDLEGLTDACIFSPPYSTTLTHSTAIEEQKKVLNDYAIKASPLNLGRLNPFLFQQAMRRVYTRIAQRLVPGAPMAIITKDIMKGPRRQMLSDPLIKQAKQCGFEYLEWFKWEPPGSMQQSIMKAKGAHVVLDEDIIIFRKR